MAVWRNLRLDDIEGLLRVADKVHPDLPESDYVFAERIKLFPQGCLALVENEEVHGYAISHPICNRRPPNLNSLLGEITPDADQYYIHDIAILPKYRGQGQATEVIKDLLDIAKSYPTTSLVSVYGTASFWGRFGFVPEPIVDTVLKEKLRNYGDDAIYLSRQNV